MYKLFFNKQAEKELIKLDNNSYNKAMKLLYELRGTPHGDW